MKKYKEGFRRLSIACGVLGVLAWIIFFLKEGNVGNFGEFKIWEWILTLIITFIAYLIPYFFIKGIYWVFDGFSKKGQ